MMPAVEHRPLGGGGLRVRAITYRSWLTHTADTVDAVRACAAASLDAGITTFGTADIYRAPAYGGPNDRGLSRKHILESCHAFLRAAYAPTTAAGYARNGPAPSFAYWPAGG